MRATLPCTLLKCMVLREKESGWGQAEPGTVNIFEGQRIYSKRDPQCMSEWVVCKRPRSQLWDRESARGLRVTLPEASLQVLWTLLHRCESKARKPPAGWVQPSWTPTHSPKCGVSFRPHSSVCGQRRNREQPISAAMLLGGRGCDCMASS